MPQNLKTLLTQSFAPKITNIAVGSATAVLPAGGQTVTVTGVGFQANAVIYINNANVVATVANSTSLTFTTPAQTAGSYQLSVYNTDGSVTFKPGGLIYFDAPVWSTSSGALPNAPLNTAYSTTLVATGGTISYSITSGSLPTGLTLNSSTGVISGTATIENTFNFTVAATNQYNQVTSRSFSIDVVGVVPSVELLMVAGGGPGGSTAFGNGGGGGGGAGGLIYEASRAVVGGYTYSITIGAGGTGSAPGGTNVKGTDTTFVTPSATLTAFAGGRGGGFPGSGGDLSGGSGGGEYGGTTGRVVGQGNLGGSGGNSPSFSGGGGGGAGAPGSTGADGNGTGGIGLQYNISGTNAYYAGGGSGQGRSSGNPGGLGGGGGAGGGAGTANTGGGGGGGCDVSSGNGGSGVCIIRYPDTYGAASATTGSPTYTVTGGYRIYRFNGNGSITF